VRLGQTQGSNLDGFSANGTSCQLVLVHLILCSLNYFHFLDNEKKVPIFQEGYGQLFPLLGSALLFSLFVFSI
jgi:hypothetical protein